MLAAIAIFWVAPPPPTDRAAAESEGVASGVPCVPGRPGCEATLAFHRGGVPVGSPQPHWLADRGRRAAELNLEPQPGGGYRYRGTGGERFDATIRPDGVVEFDIDASVQVQLAAVCAIAVCRRTEVPTRNDPADKVKKVALVAGAVLLEVLAGMADGSSQNAPSYPGRQGLAQSAQQLSNTPPPVPVGSVNGAFGYLPPPVAALSGFLDRTFVFRLGMAYEAYLRRMDEQYRRLSLQLLETWANDGLSPRQRREAILTMWDELDGGSLVHEDPRLEATLVSDLRPHRLAYADRARALIVQSVRRHAPVGSVAGFSEQELSEFNARTPGVQFEPYVSE